MNNFHYTYRRKWARYLSLTRLDHFTLQERALLAGLGLALFWGGLGIAWEFTRRPPRRDCFLPELYQELSAALPDREHISTSEIDFPRPRPDGTDSRLKPAGDPAERIYLTRPPAREERAEKFRQEERGYLRYRPAAEERININTASLEQLVKLPGIGPVIASRIIQYRERRGGFGSLKDLKKIRGIGEKRLNQIKDRLRLY